MIREGTVRRLLEGDWADIVPGVFADCSGCCGGAGCATIRDAPRERTIKVRNPIGAEPGQRVQVAYPLRPWWSMLAVTLVPACGLVLGAALGQRVGPQWWDSADGGAIAMGFAGLAVSFLIGLFAYRRLLKPIAWAPVIVARQDAPAPAGPCSDHPSQCTAPALIAEGDLEQATLAALKNTFGQRTDLD